MGKTHKNTLLSMAMTFAVVAMLVFAAPVRAVELNIAGPSDGDVGENLVFELDLDLQTGERIPIDNVTLLIEGPQEQVCVFEPDGTPITGCDGLKIELNNYDADFGYGYGYGSGFGYGYGYGYDTFSTSFGYGYGYGYGAEITNELSWHLIWNTTGAEAGKYNLSYYASSGSRTFNVEEPKAVELNTPDETELKATVVAKKLNKHGMYQFKCENNFGAKTYDWNFGDGTELIDQHSDAEVYTYTESGNYTVYCQATKGDKNAEDTLTIEVVIEDKQPGLVAELYVQENFGNGTYRFICANNFNANAYDWDFGDDSTPIIDTDDHKKIHTFAETGNYTVFCQATKGHKNAVDTLTIEVIVEEPVAELSVHEQDENTYVFVCGNNFNANAFDWNFGDGAAFNDLAHGKLTHTFHASGNYSIYCQATKGDKNADDTLTVEVIIDETPETPVEATVTLKAIDQVNSTVTFLCRNDFSANAFDWNFGDGTELIDVDNRTQTHTYNATGNYTVFCAATLGNSTLNDTITIEVVIDEAPQTPQDPFPASVDLTAINPIFNAFLFSCTPNFAATSYSWDFGDGQTATSTSGQTLHPYQPGNYTATCTASNGTLSANDTITITANSNGFPFPPQPTFPALNLSYTQDNSTVTFLCEDTFAATSFNWDFGDGTTLSGARNQTHTYNATGNYTVSCQTTFVIAPVSDSVVVEVVIEEQVVEQPQTNNGGGSRRRSSNGGGFFERWQEIEVIEEPLEQDEETPIAEQSTPQLPPPPETQNPPADDTDNGAPSITGLVTGEGGETPLWIKLLGIFGILAIVTAGIVVRLRKR